MLTPLAISAFTNKKTTAFPLTNSHANRIAMHPLALSAAVVPVDNKNKQFVKTKTEKPGLKLLIGAGVTIGFEITIGHFLEFLKIVKQVRPQDSYLTLAREITGGKGIAGILDGFFPWGFVQAIFKGSVFSWGHAMSRRSIQPYVDRQVISQNACEVMSGGLGGGIQGLVLSPLLLLKTRVMTDPVFRTKMSGWETCKKSARVGVAVMRREGAVALMKGAHVFSFKRTADWATRFFFSVGSEEIFFKRGDPNKKLTFGQRMTASLMGGILSSLTTLPIDVMVAHIQQAGKAGKKVTVFETFKEQYQSGGVRRVLFFGSAGFLARIAHVSLTTMLMKTATSVVYEMIEGKP